MTLPSHLAVIMDGNGRWAERRGRPRWTGHRAGAVAARATVEHCARIGVRQLTLFAFSSDNWSRPRPEVNAILSLCEERLRDELGELARGGIRTTVIGRRDRLPLGLIRVIEEVESATASGQRMQLRLAIDYSSRAALAHALAVPSRPSAESILPPVDVLLRTGGERRLSDFLLWECAYAELAFLDVLFPDFTIGDLNTVLKDFAQRDRRFGSVPTRVSA